MRTLTKWRRSLERRYAKHYGEIYDESYHDDADVLRRDQAVLATFVVAAASLILIGIGVLMVYSATAPATMKYASVTEGKIFSTANNQLFFALIGIVLAMVGASLPMNLYRQLAWLFLGIGVVLQALVLFVGLAAGGNKNWLGFGSVVIQPSELLKVALIVFIAMDLADKPLNERSEWGFMKWSGLAALVSIALVGGGGDMGTVLIYVLIVAVMLYVAGLNMKIIAIVGGVGTFLAGIAIALKPSRLSRVLQYFDTLFSLPNVSAPSQVDYAKWAFGSGGLLGMGFGSGVEKWPGNMAEAQTDFIYAVIGEEFGLAGTLIVLLVYIALGWGLIRLSRLHPSPFGSLVTLGIAVWLCGQAIANIMVVTGLLPVFGVPLPFVSQGGSALIAGCLGIAVALSSALGIPYVKGAFLVRPNVASDSNAVVIGG